MLKKIINKLLNIFNYKLVQNIQYIDDYYSKNLSIKTELQIFDIGMHVGESVKRYNKIFKNKSLNIHGFDPLATNIKNAKTNLSNLKHKITYNTFGLGELNSKKIFYENIKSNTSSFNKVNNKSKWVKKRSEESKVSIQNFIKKKHLMKIQTLDNYLKEKKIKKIDILKIDTQGFEYNVLKGSQNSLKNRIIDFIEIEVIFSDTYEKKFYLSEIENFLRKYDFEICAISEGGSLDQISFEIDILFKLKS